MSRKTRGDARVCVSLYITAAAAAVFNLDEYEQYIVRAHKRARQTGHSLLTSSFRRVIRTRTHTKGHWVVEMLHFWRECDEAEIVCKRVRRRVRTEVGKKNEGKMIVTYFILSHKPTCPTHTRGTLVV